MFEVFRTLFLLHEAVALDWAAEQAFPEGQLIARVRDRYRQSLAPSPSSDVLYEGIRDAVSDDEPDVALAFTLELDRRLFRADPLDPTGTWRGDTETVAIVRRETSGHPGDCWVVRHAETRTVRAAARYDADHGVLAFSPRAATLDAPWTLLPGADDVPAMWVRASRVREAERQGWRLASAWVDPQAVRNSGVIARQSVDPGASGLAEDLASLG